MYNTNKMHNTEKRQKIWGFIYIIRNILFAICIIFAIIGVILSVVSKSTAGGICICVSLILLLFAIGAYICCEILYTSIIKHTPEYQNAKKIEIHRMQEIAQAQRPMCPACHGTNTGRIKISNRIVSTSLLGLASSTIGKQYQCYDCKHKW